MTRLEPTERAFQDAVVAAAGWHGWLVHHCRPGRNRAGAVSTPIQGDVGFPDLVLVHPSRGTMFAELKSATGRLTPAQQAWHAALYQAGSECHVWRPVDWPAIMKRLAAPVSQAVTGLPPPGPPDPPYRRSSARS